MFPKIPFARGKWREARDGAELLTGNPGLQCVFSVCSDSAHSPPRVPPAADSCQVIKNLPLATARCLLFAYYKCTGCRSLTRIPLRREKSCVKFHKGLSPDFCDLILFKAHRHITISSVNLHYMILLFLGKDKSILRKCYSNFALGYLKFEWMIPWPCVIGQNWLSPPSPNPLSLSLHRYTPNTYFWK